MSWYAKGSLIQHYQVGGKTGTAQIWNPDLGAHGNWDPHYFNFTFVGYVGGDTPSAVVTVHIDDARPLPNDEIGIKLNVTSYELFRNVARAVIRATEHAPIHGSQGRRAGAAAATPRRRWSRSGITGAAIASGHVRVTGAPSPHATMPRIVSDGHLSYLPTDPTSFTADRAGDRRRWPDRPCWSASDPRRSGGFAAGPSGKGFLRVDRGTHRRPPISWMPRSPQARPRWWSARGSGWSLPDGDVTVIAVADTGAALMAAAGAWRDRFEPLVVGVTGSLAKTSTKEQVGRGAGRALDGAAQRGQRRTTRSACP